MDSIPPATTISDSPSWTACAANATAFKPEPQTLLMVIAATRGLQPPFSGACRARLCFVSAGAVKTRNGNAYQAVIHRELLAMMDVMTQDHAPNAGHARQVENFLAAGKQFPVFHHFRVAHGGKRGTRFGDILVEFGEEFLAIADLRRLETRAAHGRIVELLRVDGHRQPANHRCDVASEPADGAGFFVRLPVPLLIGTAFQDSARVLHLLVKLIKHHLSNGHDFLPCEMRDWGAPILGE